MVGESSIAIQTEIRPGTHIKDAARDARNLADRLGVAVRIRFNGETFRVTSNTDPEAIAREFFQRTKGEESPDPKADADPAPPDPVALLAEGKRCRFVRDAGPIGDSATFTAEVVAYTERSPCDNWWLGTIEAADGMAGKSVRTIGFAERKLAAGMMLTLLSGLGYRFDRVVD